MDADIVNGVKPSSLMLPDRASVCAEASLSVPDRASVADANSLIVPDRPRVEKPNSLMVPAAASVADPNSLIVPDMPSVENELKLADTMVPDVGRVVNDDVGVAESRTATAINATSSAAAVYPAS